jgi:cellobiose-specific phosphotransferase system component IIC
MQYSFSEFLESSSATQEEAVHLIIIGLTFYLLVLVLFPGRGAIRKRIGKLWVVPSLFGGGNSEVSFWKPWI